MMLAIERLMPLTFVREWYKQKGALGDSLDGLVKYLNGLFDEAVLMGFSVNKGRSSHHLIKEKASVKEKPQPFMAMSVNQKQDNKCPLKCHENHELQRCPEFDNMDCFQRWNVVKKYKRCRLCFGPHYKNECSQQKECGTNGCKGFHHRTLHFTKTPRKESSPAAA